MARKGYLLLYRRLFDHEISKNPLMVALWARLLVDAHYEDEVKELSHKRKIIIKRGQVFTSIEQLANWLKVSRTTCTSYLSIYQSMQQIDIKSFSKYTIITIRNYDKYQINLHQSIQQSIQQSDTEKEYKETKEYIYNMGASPKIKSHISQGFQDQAIRYAKELNIDLEKADKALPSLRNRWFSIFKKGKVGLINTAFSYCVDYPTFKTIPSDKKILLFFWKYNNPEMQVNTEAN